MSKRIAILQPGYWPWLGYFDQLARVDLFVHYDDVQYTRDDWRNRNRIKDANGVMWLTVPVSIRGRFGMKICEAEIAGDDWRAKHLKSIQMCYRRAAHFAALYPRVEALLGRPWRNLCDLCIAGIELIAGELRITAPTIRSSTLRGLDGLHKSERVLAICRQLGATEYLSGAAAREYLDLAQFNSAGIRVEFQDYQHPVYPQLWGDFVSHLSAIDLLMSCGPNSCDVLAEKVAAQ